VTQAEITALTTLSEFLIGLLLSKFVVATARGLETSHRWLPRVKSLTAMALRSQSIFRGVVDPDTAHRCESAAIDRLGSEMVQRAVCSIQ
jgi:hypothetical protein